MALVFNLIKKCHIHSLDSCLEFFIDHLENNKEPNLSLCSIILGLVEKFFTRTIPDSAEFSGDNELFPVIDDITVDTLLQKFVTFIKGSIDISSADEFYAKIHLVQRVSDVVWSSLSKCYSKDKAHIQSIFSLLTSKRLDAFGVALATIAGCQVLGFSDVHLAISEDHVWLVLDDGSTMEVTWHGKAVEDRRKQSVDKFASVGSWLYLGGHAVVCNRHMEFAAMVAGMNPVISGTTDSLELTVLQKNLLWLLYDKGYLDRYPMALGTLADLEQLVPSVDRPSALTLYSKAIDITRAIYSNYHVYPYLYMAHYYHRHQQYKEALINWAHAASVISRYDYSRNDEEIYKDLKEIATDIMPSMVRSYASNIIGQDTVPFPVDDPECYALLLRFIDGVCKWEEGSSLPVLHEGWVTNLSFVLGKFTASARTGVTIVRRDGEESSDDEDDESSEENNNEDKTETVTSLPLISNEDCQRSMMLRRSSKRNENTLHSESALPGNVILQQNDNLDFNNTCETNKHSGSLTCAEEGRKNLECELLTQIEMKSSRVSTGYITRRAQRKSASTEYIAGIQLSSYIMSPQNVNSSVICNQNVEQTDLKNNSVEQLVSDNIDKISKDIKNDLNTTKNCVELEKQELPINTQSATRKRTRRSFVNIQNEDNKLVLNNRKSLLEDETLNSPTSVRFRSEKMYGLRHILCAEKLNTLAIKLQLTAQSQVHLRHNLGRTGEKRSRSGKP